MSSAYFFIFIISNLNFIVSAPFHLVNNEVEYKNTQDKSGNYEYDYQVRFTRPEDAIGRSETGKIGKTDDGEEVLRVNGTYNYNPSCYESVMVTYTADENGFMAKIIQSSDINYTKVNGTVVGVSVVCSTLQNPPISSSCLASLQGGCAG